MPYQESVDQEMLGSGGWMSLAGINASSSLSDTVGRVTGRASGLE